MKTSGLHERYFEMRKAEWSAATLRGARRWIADFFRFCEERCQLDDIDEVKAEHARAFEQWLTCMPARHGRPYSARSVENALLTVRMLFRWATAAGHVAENPFAEVVLHRLAPSACTLTAEDVERLLAGPSDMTRYGLRDRALLQAIYRAGLTVEECRLLDLADIDADERALCLSRGGRQRRVPMGEPLASSFNRYLAHGRPGLHRHEGEAAVFIGEWGRRLHPGVISRIVHEHGARVGLAVNPTALRRACMVHRLRDEDAVLELQAQMGHKTASITRRYLRAAREARP